MAALARFVDEIKSSLSWIVPLSFATTVLIKRWMFAHPEYEDPKPAAQHLKFSRRRREAIHTEQEHQEKTKEPAESLFMKLPVEIRLQILEHCAPAPYGRWGRQSAQTFLALLRVSRSVQYEAYVACLPLTPLGLWTKKGVGSFRSLLKQRPELRVLVRHLWIGTGRYDEEELGWAAEILMYASQLQSLACAEVLLSKVVKQAGLSESCKRLTLTNVEKRAMYEVKGVMQLRLCAGTISDDIRFPHVTGLSVNVTRRNRGSQDKIQEEYAAAAKWVEIFGQLQTVALVGRDNQRMADKDSVQAKLVHRDGKPNILSVVVPAGWTEWDIWCSDVMGSGVWDQLSDDCRKEVMKGVMMTISGT